ncbi:MAG: hypothetical protein NTW03_08085 [Verrucomicrobia bacterium]|nr:hypothetical protein [Verrucomicrobiota bacterium]
MQLFKALTLAAGLLALGGGWPALAEPSWKDYVRKPDDWYGSAEGRRVADNILTWQSVEGGWPKNTNTTAQPFTGDTNTLKGTFDNGATTGELRFLARAFRAAKTTRYQQAFFKGLDHIIKAQYPTGGWPQFYPPGKKYHGHITFNDDAMVRLMEFLRETATSSHFDFVGADRRQPSRRASTVAFSAFSNARSWPMANQRFGARNMTRWTTARVPAGLLSLPP